VVYVELLTGKKPFNGRNIRQLAMQHMTEPPDLSAVPECDRPVLARALAKNPEDRFPSCSAFIRTLAGGSGLSGSGTIAAAGSRPLAPSAERTPLPQPKPGSNGSNLLLVTPRQAAKSGTTPAPAAPRRPAPRYADRNTQSLSASLRFEPDVGVLRPALLIGIGSFGRRALQQIRCRLLDRVGQLSQVPCVRYLYLDPDPGAAEKAAAASSDVALTVDQIFPAPLQPVTSYRRRHLDSLMEWLPREKMYAIPRSLRVDGSRALGRLAFCDHYLRFMTKLRNELAACTAPEALHQSSTFTGLSVRTKEPAVYVFVSASGGTGGMLLDVGHAVRRGAGEGEPAGGAGVRVRTGRRAGRREQPTGGAGERVRHPDRAEPLRRPGRAVRRPVRRARRGADRRPRAAVPGHLPAAHGRPLQRRVPRHHIPPGRVHHLRPDHPARGRAGPAAVQADPARPHPRSAGSARSACGTRGGCCCGAPPARRAWT
jgi:hypothetical protein